MKKDFTRDYAASAFRMWAREGRPTYIEATEKIKKSAVERAGNVSPLKALIYADDEVDRHSAMLCDILACEETFAALDRYEKHISDAVAAVYMAEPTRELRANDISSRVIRYSLKAHICERQVYRYLRQARELFCAYRGLRICDGE